MLTSICFIEQVLTVETVELRPISQRSLGLGGSAYGLLKVYAGYRSRFRGLNFRVNLSNSRQKIWVMAGYGPVTAIMRGYE